MSNYINFAHDCASCDKINHMAEDINPIARVFLIAILIITPIAIVILQRIDTVREIIKSIKSGNFSQEYSFGPLFGEDNQDERPPNICPKCYAVNPPDHKFCGYCGAEIPEPPQGERK